MLANVGQHLIQHATLQVFVSCFSFSILAQNCKRNHFRNSFSNYFPFPVFHFCRRSKRNNSGMPGFKIIFLFNVGIIFIFSFFIFIFPPKEHGNDTLLGLFGEQNEIIPGSQDSKLFSFFNVRNTVGFILFFQ